MLEPRKSEILLVDDEDLNRGLTALQLSKMGYQVAQAENGARALEMAMAHQYALLLLDIEMPGINGLDVVTRIRERHSALTLPIIMATADDQADSIVEALRRGANDYLVKPLNVQVAAARIRTQLAMSHLARLKDEFLAFASHDLKKPLMLEEDVLRQLTTLVSASPAASPLIELLIGSNRNMQNVVRGFLDANMGSKAPTAEQMGAVGINALVREVVKSNSAYAQRKHVSVLTQLDPNEPVVHSDAFRIRQILENLLGNALKFSPANTQTRVDTRVRDGALWVEVNDGGPGLTDADLRQVFQKGARLSNQPTGNEESSGVGLALCKELIQHLGGEIGARNNAPSGATFWIRLSLPQ